MVILKTHRAHRKCFALFFFAAMSLCCPVPFPESRCTPTRTKYDGQVLSPYPPPHYFWIPNTISPERLTSAMARPRFPFPTCSWRSFGHCGSVHVARRFAFPCLPVPILGGRRKALSVPHSFAMCNGNITLPMCSQANLLLALFPGTGEPQVLTLPFPLVQVEVLCLPRMIIPPLFQYSQWRRIYFFCVFPVAVRQPWVVYLFYLS